jgi:putative membrane-bound dehydrogenase-like protein
MIRIPTEISSFGGRARRRGSPGVFAVGIRAQVEDIAMRRWIGEARFAAVGLLALGWGSLAAAAPQAPAALEDLARQRPATASTFQSDEHAAEFAFDGDPQTRWCASDGSAPQWIQVDLGQPERLTGAKIVWESDDGLYRFKLEASTDAKTWKPLVDLTQNRDRKPLFTPTFQADGVRYVRLTATELEGGHWASLFDFEVYGNKPARPQDPRKRPAVNTADILKGIKVPEGFAVTVFAAPPDVRYPTCLASSPTGEVYVGIDENGSLDAKAERGRVVRCTDSDGDGKADQFTTFAKMDSPRGVVWDSGTLFVLHPPFITAYHDNNNDGVADRSETLVKGIGFDLKFRGADHTTNGIRLGIDGFLYAAVGDYGFIKAEGKDGTSLQLLGGGVVRVRTDGTGLEIVSRGQRNIYDVAIDPFLNLFTRDNTNDGGGWDVRLSHVIPTGHYGYPSLFTRFAEEAIPPLADYGGGSPCGSLYVSEPSLPAPYGDALYTCEWGRSAVYRHPMTPAGASFKAEQTTFLEIPRPTDMDVDARGNLYVSSWRDGGFTYSRPNIGYVIRVTPKNAKPTPVPEIKTASDDALVRLVGSDSAVIRLAAQRELLRRGLKPNVAKALESLAGSDRPPAARVAAVFTLEQGLGARSFDALVRIGGDQAIREFTLKAMADRKEDAAQVPSRPFVEALDHPNPRIRLAAEVALGRLGKVDAAPRIIPLTLDTDPLVSHAAVKALVNLHAIDACLEAFSGAHAAQEAPGAARALQAMHDPKAVAGLARALDSARDDATRRPILKALCRLYFREAPYTGEWWGTRPDTSGPYYKGVTWEKSDAIGQILRGALKKSDEPTARWLLAELLRNKVDFEETTALALKLAAQDSALRAATTDLLVARPKLSLDAIKFLEKVALTDPDLPSRVKATRGLLRHNSQPEARESALRALGAVGESDDPASDLVGLWLDFARAGRHARDVTTFIRQAEGSDPGRGVLGYGVLIQVEASNRAPEASRNDARKGIEHAWTRPGTTARLLRAVALAKASSFAPKVRELLDDSRAEVKTAAEFAARRLDLAVKAAPAAKPARPIATLKYEDVLASALKDPGDPALGARLFEKQSCVNCHTVSKSDAVKGPYLGDIVTRYGRAELVESILKPSAKISQGFETQKLALSSGQVYEGFVVRESGDELELRNSTGTVNVVPKKEIEERGKSDVSVMPNGLLDPLTPHDLASILAYLESLKGK